MRHIDIAWSEASQPMSRLLSPLERSLRAAQEDCDLERRGTIVGVTSRGLSEDNQRWERIGEAIAGLARQIHELCAESEFGKARPGVAGLAARLCEAIDDQVDAAAWRVIDAAAKWRASS